MTDKKQILQFQEKILAWYQTHQRDLPWRKTRNPYHILVSEVMSQQTQVGRVIPKYEAFLKVFPTVEALSRGSTGEVLRIWSGLGYNRRALNLQKTAKVITREYKGVFPQNIKELEKLPGIGKYTASAVACFAFDQQVAVIDTNIRKVIAVEFFNGTLPHEKVLEEIAQRILPRGRAYEWNQALMDYAGMVLKEHKIPVPQQSHFFTSNRYVRGQIIKQLLSCHSCTLGELASYFEERGRKVTKKELVLIVDALQKEGFLKRQKETISLSEV